MKKPFNIFVFAILLILSSLIWFAAYMNYHVYRITFQWLSEESARARYLLSVINRALVLVSGVGILCLKDIFRKIGLVLCVLTICVLPWKHPYLVFKNLAENITQQVLNTMPPESIAVSESISTISLLVSMIIVYAVDIVFALAFIYYFTRPKVKNYFK